MNVHLTRELERLVQNKVESGRYNSTIEVVREALPVMDSIGGASEANRQTIVRRRTLTGRRW